MAAPTIAAILAGLEAALATIPGLHVFDVQPGQVTVPAAIIGVPPLSYHGSMRRGVLDLHVSITVLTSAAINRDGQLALASFADSSGSKSVLLALEADPTLGGVVDGLAVMEFRPLGVEEVGVVGYFGGLFTVQVVAKGR